MDLSNLPFLSKLSILQKLRYDTLIRFRKTTKLYDSLVEKYRYKIAIKPQKLAFQFEIVLDSIGNRAKVRFVVCLCIGDGEKPFERAVTDPYKQLSAFAFEMFVVEKLGSLGGMKLETCLSETVFPLLEKMKPLCYRLIVGELPTGATLKVAQLVNSYILTTEWCSESRTDYNTMEIVGNNIIKRNPALSLLVTFSEFTFYHFDVLQKCTAFHKLEIVFEEPSFLKDLIQNLCKLSDFGNLKQIKIIGDGDIFGNYEKNAGIHLLYHTVGSPNECRDNDCRAVYLFNGTTKWLVGTVSKFKNKSDDMLSVQFIDKDPSHLLDLLVKLTLKQEDKEIDASSIREKFVNAASMAERYEIFKAFRVRMKKRQKFGSLSILKLSCCTLL